MHFKASTEDRAISATISLRMAGKELGVNPMLIKGAALAMGIALTHEAPAIRMTRADFERIRRKLAEKAAPASIR
jgi:hypothetical protein